jgi:hypothetical protein
VKPSELKARQGRPGELRTTFKSKGERAKLSLRDSEAIRVSPAVIEGPYGDVNGIAVFSHGSPRFVVTLEAALEMYRQMDEVLTALGA